MKDIRGFIQDIQRRSTANMPDNLYLKELGRAIDLALLMPDTHPIWEKLEDIHLTHIPSNPRPNPDNPDPISEEFVDRMIEVLSELDSGLDDKLALADMKDTALGFLHNACTSPMLGDVDPLIEKETRARDYALHAFGRKLAESGTGMREGRDAREFWKKLQDSFLDNSTPTSGRKRAYLGTLEKQIDLFQEYTTWSWAPPGANDPEGMILRIRPILSTLHKAKGVDRGSLMEGMFSHDLAFRVSSSHVHVLPRECKGFLQGAEQWPVIRLGREFCAALDQECPPYLSEEFMKCPFPSFHVELEEPLTTQEALHSEAISTKVLGCHILSILGSNQQRPDLVAMFHWLGSKLEKFPVTWSMSSAITPYVFGEDGELRPVMERAATFQTWARKIVRNLMDLLTSPSIKIERYVNPRKLLRRKLKGCHPATVPLDYVVKWSDRHVEPGDEHSVGSHHSYRYDVRGNWANFTKGVMAGRRIWRRPHQRGPADAPFVLRKYKTK